jgi:hypothetical protein
VDNQKIENKPEVGVNNSEPQYDPHIIPAETGARMDREHETFRTIPSKERDEDAPTDDQTDDESIDTTGGYTVDKEGLIDNFAIEPEMYYEVPGDAREKEEAEKTERVSELRNLRDDEEGKLTMTEDKRPKGQGII